MEDHVNVIRKSSRDLLNTKRKRNRCDENDMKRPVKEIRITEENIKDVANKLKTKSSISISDLKIIKNGIMDDPKYIEIILSIHGALRGIIRELTGNDAQKQVEAAACCCNLALADERGCTTSAKAAGTYLIAQLDCFNNELAVTCAWTLGNLAGSGPKVCDILFSQGAIAKLIDILSNKDLHDAALYALQHFAYQMKDDFRPDYMEKILNALTVPTFTMEYSRLIFILSCHNDFPDHVTDNFLDILLKHVLPSATSHSDCTTLQICCKFIYLLRILANTTKYDAILNYFYLHGDNVGKAVTYNLKTKNVFLKNSLLWLFGSLYNWDDDHQFFNFL